MSSQKPLIIPWLKSKIGDPDYPGLTWVNPEQTQFRIPWKHGLRQDRSDVDFKIFEGWAIENGTYKPGINEPKPSVWKRNLRSALNRKSEVRMIEDKSSDSSNPHKVYEIIRQSSRTDQESTEESQDPDDSISPTSGRPWLEEDHCNLFSLSRALDELDPLTNAVLEPESYAAFQIQEQTPQENNLLEQWLPDYTQMEGYSVHPVQETAPQEPNHMEQLLSNNILETDFEVNVYYRGVLVLSKTVNNTRGMRFTSSKAPWIRPDLEDIVLPEPSMVRDQEVARMINKVLQSLVPGLVLEVQGGTICGLRQGKCKGFWTMMENPPLSEKIQEVQKDEYTPMYTLQTFVSDLVSFMKRSRRKSPLYSIWLCLGEYWPDPNQKPWTKKFIMVKVTPVLFKLLHEMSYSTGASSLSSSEVNLQLSDSLSSGNLLTRDNLLSFLQECEEKMDFEHGS